jgi:hypothetical protein
MVLEYKEAAWKLVVLLCNVRGSNRGEKTTFLFFLACPRFEPETARIVHEALPSRPGCHIFGS